MPCVASPSLNHQIDYPWPNVPGTQKLVTLASGASPKAGPSHLFPTLKSRSSLLIACTWNCGPPHTAHKTKKPSDCANRWAQQHHIIYEADIIRTVLIDEATDIGIAKLPDQLVNLKVEKLGWYEPSCLTPQLNRYGPDTRQLNISCYTKT